MSPENRSRKCVQKPQPENVSCTSLPERDICVVDAGNHCLPRTSHFITVNSSLPRPSLLAPPGSHQSLTQMPLKPPETNEKISPNTVEKCPREKISDNTAQIFRLRLASFVTEMPKNGEDNGQNCRRSTSSKMLPLLWPASPLFFLSILLPKCIITFQKIATSLLPHSGPSMTHLSAGLPFVGTHLSIETSVSVPPWPAHHWCMVSPRKETVDFTLQVRSPPAPVGQSGCSGAGGGEGRFLGGALSTLLLCLLAPPAPPPDHPAYTSLLCCCCSGIWVESSRTAAAAAAAAAAAVSPPVQAELSALRCSPKPAWGALRPFQMVSH